MIHDIPNPTTMMQENAMSRFLLSAVRSLLVVSLLAAGRPAAAQCQPQWLAGEGVPGILGIAYAATTWDPDGPGPQQPRLVIGGSLSVAGSAAASNIAMWDGTSWASLGSGTNQQVFALAAMPNGDLIAGGAFTAAGGQAANFIARWDGANWSPLSTGVDSTVQSLALLPGGDLVAGGFFTTAGGAPANRIARWNGSSWSSLGSGMNG
jgi:hypothetical protein